MRNANFTKLALAALTMISTCSPASTPAFAEDAPSATVDDVLGVMHRLPEEGCLYNPHGKGCTMPGRFDHGPDARRIAESIVVAADGSITGNRALDAAVMATFSSYESGNDASAVGDRGRARGAMQLWFVSDSVAFDPAQSVLAWRAIARGSVKMCKDNAADEKLASVAGSCSYWKARQKVRQRMQAARDALTAKD